MTERVPAPGPGTLAPDPERLAALFLELTSCVSPSRHERPIADVIRSRLKGWGLEVREDEAGGALGADSGNLLCRVVWRDEACVGIVGATADPRPAIALGAHMDTVAPTDEIHPVLEEGVFRNLRPTILGADDKTAVAALLHATDILLESGVPFAPFELLFTICEELGLLGAKELAAGWPASPVAVVLDAGGPVGTMVVGAPSQITWKATFVGKAAHAGMEPENGRNAVLAASKAIAIMELGRLDEQTTANVGFIAGGAATNIVPERCVVKGECRSHDEARLTDVASAMVDALQLGATDVGVDVDIDLATEYRSFALTGRSPVVRLAKQVFATLGIESAMVSAGGGSDANILNERGIPTVNLGCGMTGVHAAGETQSLDDLVRTAAVALGLMTLAGRT